MGAGSMHIQIRKPSRSSSFFDYFFLFLSATFLLILPVRSQTTHRYIGFDPETCPPDTVINFHHKDVMGVWIIAPANGTIDTIFFLAGDTVGALDSTIYPRPHSSTITTTYGPG